MYCIFQRHPKYCIFQIHKHGYCFKYFILLPGCTWCVRLKICKGDEHHRYYKHTKYNQNPRGDPKCFVDLTQNDSHHNATHVALFLLFKLLTAWAPRKYLNNRYHMQGPGLRRLCRHKFEHNKE